MICTSSVYEACDELFADYPLAARAVNRVIGKVARLGSSPSRFFR